jgi:hypothetical protein
MFLAAGSMMLMKRALRMTRCAAGLTFWRQTCSTAAVLLSTTVMQRAVMSGAQIGNNTSLTRQLSAWLEHAIDA